MIVAAAVKLDDKNIISLPPPARHHDIIMHIGKKHGEIYVAQGMQGFITDTGQFLSRLDAADYARRHSQLKKPMIAPPKLYSEDLW